jgi:DNA mismatch repair ATPase MutL
MEVEYEPAGPKPIKKLSKDVVNQIAAAEVGQVIPHPNI